MFAVDVRPLVDIRIFHMPFIDHPDQTLRKRLIRLESLLFRHREIRSGQFHLFRRLFFKERRLGIRRLVRTGTRFRDLFSFARFQVLIEIVFHIRIETACRIEGFLIVDQKKDVHLLIDQKVGDRIGSDAKRLTFREGKGTGSDQRKSDRRKFLLFRKLQTFLITGGKDLFFFMISIDVMRTAGMDDVFTVFQTVAFGQDGLARFQSFIGRKFFLQAFTGQFMDARIDAAGTRKENIGRIDDRIGFDLLNVVS